jgi:hypothetical protein
MTRLVFEPPTGVTPVKPEFVFRKCRGRQDTELAKDIGFHKKRGI